MGAAHGNWTYALSTHWRKNVLVQLAKREDLTPEMLKEMAKQLTRVDGPGEDDFFVDFVLEVGDAKFQPKPLEEVISNEEKYSLEPDNESDTVIYSNGGWVRTPIAVEHVDPTV